MDPMIGTLLRPYVAKHDSSWIQPLGKEGILGVSMGTIFLGDVLGSLVWRSAFHFVQFRNHPRPVTRLGRILFSHDRHLTKTC